LTVCKQKKDSQRKASRSRGSDSANSGQDESDSGDNADDAPHDELEKLQQAFALDEFEKAFKQERANLGLSAPPTTQARRHRRRGTSSSSSSSSLGRSGTDKSKSSAPSSSSSKRRSHQHASAQNDQQATSSASTPSTSESAALLSPDGRGVHILDDLIERILLMQNGRWGNVEIVSAPNFGEVIRVDDQGVLLIAPTRTHIHVPVR
jgi:hypothetical protein